MEESTNLANVLALIEILESTFVHPNHVITAERKLEALGKPIKTPPPVIQSANITLWMSNGKILQNAQHACEA
jgi:hypothetical protein